MDSPLVVNFVIAGRPATIEVIGALRLDQSGACWSDQECAGMRTRIFRPRPVFA